jgi:hypothetical protein
MGVGVDHIDDIYTMEQLSAMDFGIKFKILASGLSKWDQNVVLHNGDHRGRIKKGSNGDHNILELDNGWLIMINPKELTVKIPGVDEPIKGLANGKKYKIRLGGSFELNELDPNTPSDPVDEEFKEGESFYWNLIRVLKWMDIDYRTLMGVNERFPFPQNLIEKGIIGGDEKIIGKYFDNYNHDIDVNRDKFIKMSLSKEVIFLSKWLSRNKKNPSSGIFSKIRESFPQFKIGGRGSLTETLGNNELWSKVVGIPLKGHQLKSLITNLHNIIGLLSKHYKSSYSKRNISEYQRTVLKEQYTRLVIENDSDPEVEDGYFILDLTDITTGESYNDGSGKPSKKETNGKSRGGNIKINAEKNSPWITGNVEKNVNDVLSSGVTVRKSEKFKDTLIIEWSKPPFEDGTEALLISKPNIWDMFNSGKLKFTDVEIGRKFGGRHELTNKTSGKITLPKI